MNTLFVAPALDEMDLDWLEQETNETDSESDDDMEE
jgi:hypothetical protein